MLITCRFCNTDLILNPSPIHSFFCKTCNQRYPVINDIPILVKNPNEFLARTFLFNEDFIRQQNKKIEQISNLINLSPDRSEILLKIKNGLIENLSHPKKIKETLTSYIKSEDIMNILLDKEEISFYGGTLQYLKRDWCWSKEGENELAIIFNTITYFIKKYVKKDNSVALVIGAGSGRTALDLCKLFDNVYAVDSSFCLVSYFYTLLKENIKFNQILERNIYSTKDFVLPFEASLCPPNSDKEVKNINKLNFFVGYATKIFLPNESVDVIHSIYFTDILPFRTFLEEVKRLLKRGGLFIHFGPLGYHFSDPENCYSAEEIKEILEQNGFTIIEETRVVSPHVSTEISMNLSSLNNWSFVAMKNTSPVSQKLTYDSIIHVKNTINYDIKGVISETGSNKTHVSIKLLNGEIYEGSTLILEILSACNKIKVSDLINQMVETYKEDAIIIKENTWELINDLYINGLLEIIE